MRIVWNERKHKKEIRELGKIKTCLSLEVAQLKEDRKILLNKQERLRKIDRELSEQIEKYRQGIKNDVSRGVTQIIKSLIETKEFYDNYDYLYLRD